MFNTIAIVEDSPVAATWSSFADVHAKAIELPTDTVATDTAPSLAHVAPQFGLRISKNTQPQTTTAASEGRNSTSEAKGTNLAIPAAALTQFRRLQDVVDIVPELDLGSETEDDGDSDENRGVQRASSPSTKLTSSLSDIFRNQTAAGVEIRLSVPSSQLTGFNYQLHLYRVASGGDRNGSTTSLQRVVCFSTLSNGTVRWELPLHGRVPWRSAMEPHTVSPEPSATENSGECSGGECLPQPTESSYFADAELTEGYYTVVVVPAVVAVQRDITGELIKAPTPEASTTASVVQQLQQLMLLTARCVSPNDGNSAAPLYRFDWCAR